MLERRFGLSPPSRARAFDNRNFFFAQVIKFIDQFIDARIGRRDLPSSTRIVLRRARFGQLRVQRQHLLDQFHHRIVTRDIGFIRKINRANVTRAVVKWKERTNFQ